VTLRELNRLRVIEALYRHPGSTRAELARRSGLSRPTVTAFLEELARAGFVHDAAGSRTPRAHGRPPARLSLEPRAALAIGLDFGHQHIRVALCDLAGAPLATDWSPAQVDHAPGASLDLARELVNGVLRDAGVARERVLGVGMALAAPVERDTGAVHAEGFLPGWVGLRPGPELEARLGLPVTVQNDANAGALGEKVFGAGRGVDDLVYLRLSAGIGAGLVLAGRPYEGAGGVAGELGHVVADPGGLICRCGNRGCLETVASPVAVAALLERSRGEPVSEQRLLQLVRDGDRGAVRAVEDAAEAAGRVVAAVVNLINPELVIVGGELATAGDVVLAPLGAAIRRYAVAPAAARARVRAGELGQSAEVLGAAALILAESPRALARRVDVA
jgi:predicted NBD/HSP70 family sugar kinase